MYFKDVDDLLVDVERYAGATRQFVLPVVERTTVADDKLKFIPHRMVFSVFLAGRGTPPIDATTRAGGGRARGWAHRASRGPYWVESLLPEPLRLNAKIRR